MGWTGWTSHSIPLENFAGLHEFCKEQMIRKIENNLGLLASRLFTRPCYKHELTQTSQEAD